MEAAVRRKRKYRIRKREKRRLVIIGAALLLAAIITVVAVVAHRAAVEQQRAEYVPLTDEEIAAVLAANTDVGEREQAVIDAALTLVGKLHYFWGGKSSAIGWDDRWGEPTLVTSTGSASYGTERPYGMDCSGFVSWCFIQLGMSPVEVETEVGNGTWNQWDKTSDIPWKELRPGDFVFQRRYPSNEGNHIGICIGYLDGDPVFVHLAAGFDNVVVTRAGDVFTVSRRPSIY